MLDIENIMMNPTYELATEVEKMRYKAYGVKKLLDVSDSEYIPDIMNGDELVFLSLVDKNPIAACYISSFNNFLYVDYLFVLPEYQNTGLHIGRNLLEYVLKNKIIVEEHFKQKFKESSLCPGNMKVAKIYESLGYKMNPTTGLMKKKI